VREPCANCGENIDLAFCPACGQRRFVESDRRIAHLLQEFFESATNFDSRFWRSLRALIFKPGKLSRQYIIGRRGHWMAPVSLFVLANVLYFFAPGLKDFELPFNNQVSGTLALASSDHLERLTAEQREALSKSTGQVHSAWTSPLVAARIAERDAAARKRDPGGRYTARDYARAYDARSADISKLLIFLHVPMLALVLSVLFWDSRRYFAEHFVVALHLFAFVLFFIELVLLPGEWLASRVGLHVLPVWATFASLAVMGHYFALGMRRVYEVGWWRAVPSATLLMLAMFTGSLYLYRTLQFLVIYALI
jgi:hypothetical protein